MINIEETIKQKEAMVEQLLNEIKELKKQLKSFTLVCECDRIYNDNGKDITCHKVLVSHHKNKKLAIAKSMSIKRKWKECNSCKLKFENLKFTLNGEKLDI